ncbi:MAG: TolC family protein [Gemmatimonadota bacterium]|nr:TolC family protein [Gemmatimonadota bacterium]MDE2871943.1 TolC family protein [Gemmatimonadota bacterium]
MKTGTKGLTRGAAVLAALAALGGGMDAAGQEGGGGEGATVLTLRDALNRATRFNASYRQALEQLELQSHPRRQWWAPFLPTVDLFYSTGYNVDRRPSYLDLDGTPIQNPEPQIIRRSSSVHQAQLRFTVLDGGQRFHDLRTTRAQVRQSRVAAERQLNATLADIQRRYQAAQQAQAQLAVEEALLADRQVEFGEQQKRFELLAIERSALLGAQLDLEGQRLAVRTARGELDKALLALRTAIGDPGLGALEIESQPPEPFDPSTLDLAELVSGARRQSPGVVTAEAEVEVQRANLNSQKAWRWPSVSLNTTIGGSTNGEDGTELFGFDTNTNRFRIDANVGLSFTVPIADVLPIFDGFQKSYNVASASMTLRNAEAELQQTALQLEETIRSRYVDLETAWANVQQQRKAHDVAAERLGLMRQQYLLATVSIDALRTAIREEATARRNAVDRRFGFATALLALYEEVGIVAREAGIAPPAEGN